MKKPCAINIVTTQDKERFDFTTSGTIDFLADAVYIDYVEGSLTDVTIGVSNKIATITRRDEDGYTLMAEEGKSHDFTLAGQNLTLFTKKILSKQNANSYDLALSYSIIIGKNSVENKVFVKCRY